MADRVPLVANSCYPQPWAATYVKTWLMSIDKLNFYSKIINQFENLKHISTNILDLTRVKHRANLIFGWYYILPIKDILSSEFLSLRIELSIQYGLGFALILYVNARLVQTNEISILLKRSYPNRYLLWDQLFFFGYYKVWAPKVKGSQIWPWSIRSSHPRLYLAGGGQVWLPRPSTRNRHAILFF